MEPLQFIEEAYYGSDSPKPSKSPETNNETNPKSNNDEKSTLAGVVNAFGYITIAIGIIGGIIYQCNTYGNDGIFILTGIVGIIAAVPMFALARCVRAADCYLKDRKK